MSDILHLITVDVKFGFEQDDPRWAFAGSTFKDSEEVFAFWDIKTTTKPTKGELRKHRVAERLDTEGVRPGEIPSVDIESVPGFGTVFFDNCQYVYPEEERVASLRVVKRRNRLVSVKDNIPTSNDDSSVIDTELKDQGIDVSLETNSFLLQGMTESFQEKFQIKETFGDPAFFAFGERQKVFQFNGILFDTDSWAWKEKFLDEYNNHLRGSKAIENGAFVTLITNTSVIQGYLLSCQISQDINTHGYVAVGFAMFVQDRFPLAEIIKPKKEGEKDEEEPGKRLLVFNINSFVGKDDGVSAEYKYDTSLARIYPPTGWFGLGFGQTSPEGQRPTHFRPSTPVEGEDREIVVEWDPAGFVTYDPPRFQRPGENEPPNKYVNAMMIGSVGRIGAIQRRELATPPDATPQKSMHVYEAHDAVSSGQFSGWSTGTIFFQSNRATAHKHGREQIKRLQAIAKAGDLTATIVGGDPGGLTAVSVKIKDLRKRGETGYRSTSFQVSQNDSFNFEVILTKPVLATDFGYAGRDYFIPDDLFSFDWFEDNQFIPEVDFAFKPVERVIHNYSSKTVPGKYFHQVATVFEDAPVNKMENTAENHILEAPSATFQTDLQPHLDAGDDVFVRAPYPVFDIDVSIGETNAELKVQKVLSQTTLQLGKLRLNPANKTLKSTEFEYQPIAEINFESMDEVTVIVRRKTTVPLVETEIRKRIKNPPDGAFLVEATDSPDQKLVNQAGVFKMEKGVHYTDPV